MSIVIRVEGLDRLVRAVDRAHGGMTRALGAATLTIGEQIRRVIAVAPGPPKYPLRWASAKQRAAYLAKRRAEGLGAYSRINDPWSQQLTQKWATERYGRVGAVVGTLATYAPYVQSAKQQQPFHADTGWITDEKAVQRVRDSGVIPQIVADAIHKLFAG